MAVGLYITAAYWFTVSTSFAKPSYNHLWTATLGNPPPGDLAAGLMRLALAWQAQRRIHGGLDRDTALLCDLRRGLPRNPQYRSTPSAT
jgi:hypothetical protein